MSESAHKAYVLQLSPRLAMADQATLKLVVQEIEISINWVKGCKEQLLEQFRRKVIVLE